MRAKICSRCKKNVAVVFITKIEDGKNVTQGLCLNCARELKIKQVDDLVKNLGLTDEELDGISSGMGEALEMMGAGALGGDDDDGDEESGKTATFPFLDRLVGGEGIMKPDEGGTIPPPPVGEKGEKKSKRSRALEAYCINLSQRAREKKLDAMIGRTVELERVIQILNRRQKNNPCLIGEPGVGKTAIAEGLACRIAADTVPYKLRGKEVYLLDLTALVAGTQFRGQFESRMKSLIEDIRKQGNIILVIDEVHNIVGAGDAEGAMNAANILKPALSRGEIQVIGATTFAEYRKHIEKDAALERRFQPVTVEEPSLSDAVQIIKGIAHYYEDFHGVEISDEMCQLAVTLSERYITDRFLPDKAIDLIDEACSDVNLKNRELEKLGDVIKERADLEKERDLLLGDAENDHFERLAVIRSRDLQLAEQQKLLEQVERPKLSEENLARIIELWTKIPASNIRADEFTKLAELHSRLSERIIGQDKAVSAVCSAIKRSRIGLTAKRKPVSFIFVGSTGVGKTELVKQLANDLFDSPESLIRLDMSEYMEKHAVSRIIGSPPGYVGYDEAGQLTEKIRRKPYCVVLFDEIEKAHPDVLNVMLQILDDGRVTDSHGRTVNFENTVIVMTTNAGSAQKGNTVGFNQSENDQTEEKAMRAMKEFLRPEFLNRVDEIICFNRLTQENFRKIAVIMLEELKTAMHERHMALSYDDTVLDFLCKHSYSSQYGARNLRRCIQREIETIIASEIIDERGSLPNAVAISAVDDKIKVIAK